MRKYKSLQHLAAWMLFAVLLSLTSCRKGEDDPLISLRTRKARFANEWTLVKYEKNGERKDIGNSTYIYNTSKDGYLKETIEGAVFGVATRRIREGSWDFVSDKEDVKITIDNDVQIFQIQRLANKELWLKMTDGADTYQYYFDGQ
jgi:hypothetical protein